MNLKFRPAQASSQQKHIAKRFRRRARVLRKQQLEIMNDYDDNLMDDITVMSKCYYLFYHLSTIVQNIVKPPTLVNIGSALAKI